MNLAILKLPDDTYAVFEKSTQGYQFLHTYKATSAESAAFGAIRDKELTPTEENPVEVQYYEWLGTAEMFKLYYSPIAQKVD